MSLERRVCWVLECSVEAAKLGYGLVNVTRGQRGSSSRSIAIQDKDGDATVLGLGPASLLMAFHCPAAAPRQTLSDVTISVEIKRP